MKWTDPMMSLRIAIAALAIGMIYHVECRHPSEKVLWFQNLRTLDTPPSDEASVPTPHEVEIPFPAQNLLSALRAVESSNRADAVSEQGARGLYQIMPLTWQDHSSEPFSRAFDPELNERVAIAYLIWIGETLLQWRPQEDEIPVEHILSCWHGGIGRFRSREYDPDRMPDSTQEFVSRMKEIMNGIHDQRG